MPETAETNKITHRVPPPMRALKWVRQHEMPFGGIRTHSGHPNAYPEVSGYFVPTLLQFGERGMATRLVSWLMSIQMPSGAYAEPDHGEPYLFDTGQVLRGLLAGIELVPGCVDAARRAADYLYTQMIQGGEGGFGSRYAGSIPESVHLYVLPPLLRAARVLREPKYFAAAERCIAHYTVRNDTLQIDNLTHFLGYELEALIELGRADIAAPLLEALREEQAVDGSVRGAGGTSWVCCPGLAQLAVCWYKVGQWEPADKALAWLEEHQTSSGGFLGSHGPGADYLPQVEVSWAVKYYLDAHHLRVLSFMERNALSFPTEVSISDGRARAILEVVCPGDKVLEVGCGKGRFLKIIRRAYPDAQCTGVDISPALLREVPQGIQRLEGSLESVPCPENSFDVVFSIEAIEHSANLEQAMAEMIRVTRPGGWVVVIDKQQSHWGRLVCPPWEYWPDAEYLKQLLMQGCDDATWEPVSYDGQPADGLMLVWRGRKRSSGVRSAEREKWDRYYATLPLMDPDEPTSKFNEEFVEALEQVLESGSKVLEAGCGAGWQSLALAERGKVHTHLMDFSREALNYAHRLFEKHKVEAEFVYGDVFDPGTAEYDLVFNAGVLEHYTFDQQVAFLRGMASRSRRYVLVLVPNRLCYWYWIWRVQKSGSGEWPFGKEAPSVDLSAAFEAAGLNFLGQRFIGETWAESFLNTLVGVDNHLRKLILEVHRSPLLPKPEKCYLLAALGSVRADDTAPQHGWELPLWQEEARTAEVYAGLADALALRVGAERQLIDLTSQTGQLRADLAEQEEAAHKLQEALEQRVGEYEETLQGMRDGLATRDERIRDLRAGLAEQEEAAHKLQEALEQRVREHEGTLQGMRDGLAARDERIRGLQGRVGLREAELTDLRFQLDNRDRALAERQHHLDTIYASRGFRVVARVWEGRAAWRQGPRALAKFLMRFAYRQLPARLQHLTKASYYRFCQRRNDRAPKAPTTRSETILRSQYGVGVPGLVSVVLPVYNQASMLRDAMQSVLAQTYPMFEVIIVNDGSTDGVEQILNEFVDHPKVRILSFERNAKLPRALNAGFRCARGEFWTWTSADNLMRPCQLERHVAFLRSNLDVAMVYSDYAAIDDRGEPLRDPSFRPHNREKPTSPEIRLPRSTEQFNIVRDNFIGACFMYRAWVGNVLGLYDPKAFGAEDYDYWMRINSQFKIAHLGTAELLYEYRVHDNTLNARATELGIFDRVDRLMALDERRRAFYREPFLLFADAGVLERMGGALDYQTLEAAISGRPKAKRAVLLGDSEETRMWLASVQPEDRLFVAVYLLGDGASAYEWAALSSRVDMFLVETEKAFARVQGFGKPVFCCLSPWESWGLVKVTANEVLFRRVELDSNGVPDPQIPQIFPARNRRPKVILQVEHFDKGGLEQVVLDLACGLRARNWDPIVLVLGKKGAMARRAGTAGIEVIGFEEPPSEASYGKTINDLRPDIINAHSSWLAARAGAERGISFVQTLHNTYVWLTPAESQRCRENEAATRLYVCVSRNVQRYADLRLGFDPARMRIIPNGIDTGRFQATPQERKTNRQRIRRIYGLRPDDFVMLCTSAFYRHKGQLEAVLALGKAARQVPNLRLLFLGARVDDEYFHNVMQAVRESSTADRVVLAGHQEDPISFYQAADGFILPSYWEGWSLALAEAAASGLPVIATDAGASRELLEDGVAGILIQPPFGDICEIDWANWGECIERGQCRDGEFVRLLADAMEQCAQRSWPEAELERSRAIIRAKYTIEQMIDSYQNLYLYALSTPAISMTSAVSSTHVPVLTSM